MLQRAKTKADFNTRPCHNAFSGVQIFYQSGMIGRLLPDYAALYPRREYSSETGRVFYEEGSECLNIIQVDFILQRVKTKTDFSEPCYETTNLISAWWYRETHTHGSDR
jgi:hypothetical protein